MGIELVPLAPEDREQVILDNQEAFRYGALEEFGPREVLSALCQFSLQGCIGR